MRLIDGVLAVRPQLKNAAKRVGPGVRLQTRNDARRVL